WSLIAGRLPGRTDNEIKNYWNTNLAKKIQDHSTSTPKSSIKSKEKKRPVTGTSVETRTSKPKIKSSTVVKTKALRCTKLFFSTTTTTPESQIVENRDRIRGSTDHYMEMKLESGNEFLGCPLRGKNLLQNYDMDFKNGENCWISEFSQLCNFDAEKLDDFSSPSSDDSLFLLDVMLQNWAGNDCIQDGWLKE
ncbi:hypothetical protein MKX01_022712, partial [Papaver californicum]